jgi:hypothetical protein
MTAPSFALQDTTLKSRLQDWTDWDWAAYSLGVCLGLMPDEPDFGTAKHVFRSHHPIGRFLYEMLNGLAEQGILQYRDDVGVQYRWNASFQGSWD